MNIAIIVRQFPNIVQTYILNQIISIKKSGHQTIIIAGSNPNQAEVHPAVYEYDLPKDTIYINTAKNHLLKELLTIPAIRPRYLSVLSKILFSKIWNLYGIKYVIKAIVNAKSLSIHNIDIAHSHTLFSSYEYLFLKDVFQIPIITTFHGFEPKTSKSLAIEKIRIVLEKSDIFIVNTRFAKKQLTDMGCHHEKIRIIPQGTNTLDFPYLSRHISTQKPVIILSVGRLSIEKGFHTAIKAMARVVNKIPGIQYHIIGSGPEEANLTALIQSEGLENTVKIFSSVSTDELLSHYTSAQIFVLPSIDFRDGSHTETQGVVLQEAQSSGIPIIASKTGGIPEVVKDGVTGLLFDEENDSQLSHLIESLIINDELFQRLSLQARKDVEDNYSIDFIGGRLNDVYESALLEKLKANMQKNLG